MDQDKLKRLQDIYTDADGSECFTERTMERIGQYHHVLEGVLDPDHGMLPIDSDRKKSRLTAPPK